MPLLTIKTTIGTAVDTETLVDGGSQLNLLSATLAKEQDLKVEALPGLMAEAANGSDISIYGVTIAEVHVRDSRNNVRIQEIPFVVADLKRYDIYLGLPWIDDHNPKLNFASRRMYHRGQKAKAKAPYTKVDIEDAEEFSKTLREPGADLYACLVNSIGQLSLDEAKEAQIPPEYAEYEDVFSKEKSSVLAEHGSHDLAIELQPGTQPPHQPLYNLSEVELQYLRKYLAEYLQRGWIRRSRSPAGAPILFAKKKDGTLRLCVDYRGLNKVTVRDRHALPLITESLERLSKAKFYTKLDIREAYHRIRIQEGDEWKTAFRTRYGHYEYTVMPFGLTNAPARFQAYINQALAGLIDVSCIVYLDDILIFSDTEEEHREHVKEILQRLREARLFAKLSKCEFHTKETEYLGYVVTPDGVKIDPERVRTILEWPIPKTVRDIRIFIGFMNYYRRFIQSFSKLATPLNKLTQKGPNAAKGGHAQRKEESKSLDIGQEGMAAFQNLKDAFLGVPILAHFKPGRDTKVETDASGGAISGILSQLCEENGQRIWRPVDFYSRKLIAAEYNYDTKDKELLGIDASLQHWRHHLEGIQFTLYTDHDNLKGFMDNVTLTKRQVRVYQRLVEFDFVIKHTPGVLNPADGPSRRPDYMKEFQTGPEKTNEAYVEPLQKLLNRTSRDHPSGILAIVTRSQALAQGLEESDPGSQGPKEPEEPPSTTPRPTIPIKDAIQALDIQDETNWPKLSTPSPVEPSSPKSAVRELATEEEKSKVLRECHDDPMAGHFGWKKTLEKVRRQHRWQGMTKDIKDYCYVAPTVFFSLWIPR